MTTIGERILQRRTELNMSQDELAVQIGYKDRSSIAKIESGERDIRQNKVVALAKALHTTPQWLMGYDEENPPAPQPTAEQTAILERIEKLNPEQLQEVGQFVEFLISKRQDSEND